MENPYICFEQLRKVYIHFVKYLRLRFGHATAGYGLYLSRRTSGTSG
jgi:hypothetical protein